LDCGDPRFNLDQRAEEQIPDDVGAGLRGIHLAERRDLGGDVNGKPDGKLPGGELSVVGSVPCFEKISWSHGYTQEKLFMNFR
jgi:hypothetical protein